jgi:hypothetical protein
MKCRLLFTGLFVALILLLALVPDGARLLAVQLPSVALAARNPTLDSAQVTQAPQASPVMFVENAGEFTEVACSQKGEEHTDEWGYSVQEVGGRAAFLSSSSTATSTLRIVSDGTWRVSGNHEPGWETIGFDDSSWGFSVAPAPVACGWVNCWYDPDVFTMWSEVQHVTIYLRRSFVLVDSTAVISATIKTSSDDDHDLYINGTLVASDWNGYAGPTLTTDIKEHLQTGLNVIAIKASDTAGGCRSMCVDANIQGDTTPPMTIIDLAAHTRDVSGEVELTWTAPGDDGGAGTATTYIVRYADSPIVSEFGWLAAIDVDGEPIPQPAGSSESMTVSGLTPGQTYYFAIKTQDEVPNTSGLSNSPGVVELGFRPNPDGYSFANYGGVNYNDFTIEDMRRMFGDAAVCIAVQPTCQVRSPAERWRHRVNELMAGGHCDGFTTTSLRFFKGIENPADFQDGAGVTHDLQLDSVRRHIAYHWVLQVPDPVAIIRTQALKSSPGQVLDQLRSAMSDGAADPTTLLVYNTAGTSGHSITPYAIDDEGDGVYLVRVYDNNHPDDANRCVEIDMTNDTWSYDLGSGLGTWSGDANTHSLGAIPISLYAQQPVCPWCNGTKMLSGVPAGQVWLSGQGHLLLTDAQGRHIGYIGDQFVNEVPGAFGSVPPGGLGIPQEPIYTLPLTDTYTILLDGQTLTQTETVAVTQFGPGYAVSVDDVALGPTSQDQLVVAPDGTQLAYQSNSAKEATLVLALDGASESNQLQLNGANIGAGQVVTLTADVGTGQLVFNNAQAGGGAYDLEVTRVSTAGERRFFHADIDISAADTHHMDYVAWNGSGAMTLHIDHDSDGTIDETLELENQANHWFYLPLVFKHD